MLRTPPVAALAALIMLASVSVSAGGAPPLDSTVPPGVALGLAQLPRRGELGPIRTATREPPDLLLRVPPYNVIAALVDSTSTERIRAAIERLEAFGSRYVAADSCGAASRWIVGRFEDLGYVDVRVDTFPTPSFQDTVDATNVIAFHPGTTLPNEYVVLGGHYDSISWENFDDPDAPAPGAEDNGTGAAAVLEAARVLASIPTHRTIIFACWSAEETGLWGSKDFVAQALQDSLDIILALNMDSIGYRDPDAPPGEPVIVSADSSAFAVAAFLADVAAEHAGLDVAATIAPAGPSDHASFWAGGYSVLYSRTSAVSPHRHTRDDTIDDLDLELARAVAAANIVATASVAGIVGEDANLAPETTLAANCSATHDVLGGRPVFEWSGTDFDGDVVAFHYRVDGGHWTSLPTGALSLQLGPLDPGDHSFSVRATDDAGAVDPTPASHAFIVSSAVRPVLTIDTNFLPGPVSSVGRRSIGGRAPLEVFENELLLFDATSDASSYCGNVESIAVAVNDSSAWDGPLPSPRRYFLRPAVGDTAIWFRTRDENGRTATVRLTLCPVPVERNRLLLHVDDAFGGSIPEAAHDAFYDSLLADHDHDTWDPTEHVDGYLPQLPGIEELGVYHTVLWTVGDGVSLLRPAQAESAYHALEGYVRAGGNLIIEGFSPVTTLAGCFWLDPPTTFAPGEFIRDHAGVAELNNAGAISVPSVPENYGYAFLGATPVEPAAWAALPVDTAGKWSEGHATYGGLPLCEAMRPDDSAVTLYLFRSYLNPTLDGRPCVTLRRPRDGTGSVGAIGFPLYYLRLADASAALSTLLERLVSWQSPSDLVFFNWQTTCEAVSVDWYLDPPTGPVGCHIERADGAPHSGSEYVRLNEAPISFGDGLHYTYRDSTVVPSSSYSYRLKVVERWGGVSTHGPWEVSVPAGPTVDRLFPPRPNPSPGPVEIRYSVGADHRWVSVAVYDVAGRLVARLRESARGAGTYTERWDGRSDGGDSVASGVYFVRVRIGQATLERKVVLIR